MEHMTQAQAMRATIDLFEDHSLHGWVVRFGNAKRSAGTCDSGRKVITLSKYLLAQRSYEASMMTITHEVAHAIVGAHRGHDAVWARKHRELGGDGQRCVKHLDEQAPWIGECEHGKKHARYRAPKPLEGWRCCCPGSGPVVWRRNGVAA